MRKRSEKRSASGEELGERPRVPYYFSLIFFNFHFFNFLWGKGKKWRA